MRESIKELIKRSNDKEIVDLILDLHQTIADAGDFEYETAEEFYNSEVWDMNFHIFERIFNAAREKLK